MSTAICPTPTTAESTRNEPEGGAAVAATWHEDDHWVVAWLVPGGRLGRALEEAHDPPIVRCGRWVQRETGDQSSKAPGSNRQRLRLGAHGLNLACQLLRRGGDLLA